MGKDRMNNNKSWNSKMDCGSNLFKFHLDNKKSNFFKKKRIRFFLKKFDFLLSKWNLNRLKLGYFCDKKIYVNNKYISSKFKSINKYLFDMTLSNSINGNSKYNNDKYYYYIINDYYTDTKSFLKKGNNSHSFSNWNFKSLNVNILIKKYKLSDNNKDLQYSLIKRIWDNAKLYCKSLLLIIKIQWMIIVLLLILITMTVCHIQVYGIYKLCLYEINDFFNVLTFQSFFFFNEFFFKEYFNFDFSNFYSNTESGINLFLQHLFEFLKEDTDLGFLFFTFIYPFSLWVGSNLLELIEVYILPFISPFFPKFYFFLEEWIEFFFSKDILHSLFPPYLMLYANCINTYNELLFSIVDFEHKVVANIEKINVFKYIYMESWFGEFKLTRVISPWREYMKSSNLPMTMEYNVFYKLYALYNSSNFFFTNYNILHDAFKNFVPIVFNGYYYIFNTVNLLELNINTHAYKCKEMFNFEEWALISTMSNKIRELVNRDCIVYNSYFLVKKILISLLLLNYGLFEYTYVSIHECMKYIYDVSFIYNLYCKLYYRVIETLSVFDIYNKYISYKLYIGKLYSITNYKLYWLMWETSCLIRCIINVYANWLFMYMRYRDIPLYLSRFWSFYLAELFHVTPFSEKYFFGFIKKHFVLTETYIRMMEYREAYLTSKSTVVANLNKINKINEIFYKNYKDKWFLYEGVGISILNGNNNTINGDVIRGKTIFSNVIDDSNMNYIYILHFFLEDILQNVFQEKMKNVNIIHITDKINMFIFHIKLLMLSLSDQYRFVSYMYVLFDNFIAIVNYFFINNFILMITFEESNILLRKFFVYFYDFIYLREFFGDLSNVNYRVDLNLSKVITYLTNPYSGFKLKYFVDWSGMILDTKNVFMYDSLFNLVLKDGIFFYKKLPKNNFFLSEYINMNKIFLYWNNQFVLNILYGGNAHNIHFLSKDVVSTLYFNKCENILDWFYIIINNDKFINNNNEATNLVDIHLYNYIYKNIFYYDYCYSYMYGEFSFLKSMNDGWCKYSKVFLWKEEHINKFSFFFDRYYDLLQRNFIEIIFNLFVTNIDVYSFSGLVNIIHGLQNFYKNFVVVMVVCIILNIYLIWYHIYLYVYKYDIWNSIINVLYPKDLDFLLRNVDLNKKRGNFFHKGITVSGDNYDISRYQKLLDKLDVFSLKTERLAQNNLFWVKRRISDFLFRLSNLNFMSTHKESIYRKFLDEEELILDDENFITKRKAKEIENLERYGDPTVDDEFMELNLEKFVHELSELKQNVDINNLGFSWKELEEIKYESKLISDYDIFESVWWNWEKKLKSAFYEEEESVGSGYVSMKKNISFFDKDNIYKDIVNMYYQFSQFSNLNSFFTYALNDRMFSLYSIFFPVSKILKKSSRFFFFKPLCKKHTGVFNNNYFVFFYPYLLDIHQIYKNMYVYLLFFNIYMVVNIYIYMYVDVWSMMYTYIILIILLLILLVYKYVRVYMRYKIWNIAFFQKKYFINLLMIIIFFVKNVNFINNSDFYGMSCLKKGVKKMNNILVMPNVCYNYEIVPLKYNMLIFSNLSYNSILYFNNVFLNNVINNFCFTKVLEHSVKSRYFLERVGNYKYLDTSNYCYFYLFKYYMSAYDIVYKTKVISYDINSDISNSYFKDHVNLFRINTTWYNNVYNVNSRWFSSFDLGKENMSNILKLKKAKGLGVFMNNNYKGVTTIFNIDVQDLFKYFYIPVDNKLSPKYKLSLKVSNGDNDRLRIKINLIEIYTVNSNK